MNKKLVKISIGALLLISQASSKCYAYESSHSVGLGLQYAGIIGWQASVSQNNLNGRFAVGVLGASLGGDLYLNKNIAMGVTATSIAFGAANIASFNLNYYFKGVHNAGWIVGLDAGSIYDNSLFGGSGHDRADPGRLAFLSAGYRFN